MRLLASIQITLLWEGRKIWHDVDLCERPGSPNIWLRVNRPNRAPIRRSLRTSDLAEAKRRAHLTVQQIFERSEWTAAGPGDGVEPLPTIAEFAKQFREWYARQSTGHAYENALVKVARIAGLDPEKAHIDQLDDQVIYRFLDFSPGSVYTKRTTALNARAPFAPRHRRFWSRWEMPAGIETFRSAQIPNLTLPDFRPFPDNVMDSIIEAAPKLCGPLWRCHLMLREIGLRSSEALAAKKEWIEKSRGEWFFSLEAYEMFKGKNASALRRLPIAADLAKELLAGPGPYIVDGESENERFDLVKRHHAKWLRQFIPTSPAYSTARRHPNQALRRQFVERCIGELGWDIKTTANYTRHDPKTLLDWYAGGKMQAPPTRINPE